MVLKSILVATEILIYSERRENADYYGEKIIVVSVRIKKLWRVKVSVSETLKAAISRKSSLKLCSIFWVFFHSNHHYRQKLC